ncbi:MAG: hypothetical protein WCY01_04995 [Alkalispirochaeta sp.]
MKWQGYNEKAADRVNKLFIKAQTSRSILVMIAVTALVVIATSSSKWGG